MIFENYPEFYKEGISSLSLQWDRSISLLGAYLENYKNPTLILRKFNAFLNHRNYLDIKQASYMWAQRKKLRTINSKNEVQSMTSFPAVFYCYKWISISDGYLFLSFCIRVHAQVQAVFCISCRHSILLLFLCSLISSQSN
jgi:hypothetical protein